MVTEFSCRYAEDQGVDALILRRPSGGEVKIFEEALGGAYWFVPANAECLSRTTRDRYWYATEMMRTGGPGQWAPATWADVVHETQVSREDPSNEQARARLLEARRAYTDVREGERLWANLSPAQGEGG